MDHVWFIILYYKKQARWEKSGVENKIVQFGTIITSVLCYVYYVVSLLTV